MGWITAVAVYLWSGGRCFSPSSPGALILRTKAMRKKAGAPSKPRIGLKFLVTTVIAAIVWVLIYLTVTSGLISFRT